MKRSKSFVKTRHQAPTDEESKNAQLLIKAGYIHKEMAGVYTFLPLGLRALENINTVIRQEMNKIGGQELRLTTLQDSEIWKTTGRWDDDAVDVWFKTKLKNNTEIGLGWTHEEPLVRAAKSFVNSYKDLPFLAYQIQTKFRNETRAKSGVMRCREFLMKDMYSFARTIEEHDDLYEKIKQAYFVVFERLGIGEQTYLTFASGGSFSKYSHEFQTVTEAGEDTIFLSREHKIAVNQEVLDNEVLDQLGLSRDALEEVRGAEVGNIFTLKDKYSTPLNLTFTDENGEEKPVLMGCYGIGPSRLLGVITELLADDKGLVWPVDVAPYKVYLANLGENAEVAEAADKLYQELSEAGIETIYDDRSERPGEKFADADLMGIPYRIVVSEKSLAAGGVELKKRTSQEVSIIAQNSVKESLV
jgi:prolyl-tRNA synthetase